MVYEGAFLPAGMGWDTYDGIGIGRYMIGLDGMGADIPFYYYYSSLEPPPPLFPPFLKLYMYYVLCTCLNESLQ